MEGQEIGLGETGREKSTYDSTTAYTVFLNANKQFATSDVAQASAIAVQCKKLGLDPTVLGNALLHDAKLKSKIADIANRIHENAGASHAPFIDTSWVESIVGIDFEYAQRMMSLSDNDLLSIQEKYRKVQRSKKGDYQMTMFTERLLKRNERKAKMNRIKNHITSFFKRKETTNRDTPQTASSAA